METCPPQKAAAVESAQNKAVTDYLKLQSTLNALTKQIHRNDQMSDELKTTIDEVPHISIALADTCERT